MAVETPQYPVNLVLERQPCLVVGAGRIASRKADGLLACGARVHVVAEHIDSHIRALNVSWEERPYQRGDVAGYRLVIAATDDPAVNRAVYEDGEAEGVWVNSADDPASCAFTLPSVIRQGAVMVTVSTGGRSPALSAWLGTRLGEQLGPEYGVLGELLATERERLKAAGRSSEGLDWQKALDSDMLDLIRSGQVDRARELLQACLSSS
ncbi:MAG TPA: bifunctional precorrin-2 dehydrogenase/sirohydrochlorin ferrochelatase [Acidimicrobiales bacterium]|jgi:precorrin-2 dehydrogenase/sirohydrochlorin ferrochelatase|nr:bifunctional precorrin-2 dehydrogenase/sirohydrochlorin ferrochelatase [Acidimicrobiales bacterium]